jgi:hypothetical protein
MPRVLFTRTFLIAGAMSVQAVVGRSLPAQAARNGAAPDAWRTTVEANGTLLYGAASQRVMTATLGTQQATRWRQVRADLQAGYGDARDQTSGLRRVIVRNIRGTTSIDLVPQATISPFAFALGESSLQQRIAERYSGGAGAKYTFWRPEAVRGGFQEDASVSLAALGEQTRAVPREGSTAAVRGAGARYRWSVRARYRRRLGESLRFSHLSFYQPTIDRPARYTLESNTSLAVPLVSRVEFTVTHRERFDSEAVDRGAPSNRDGQLLFGVRATF